MPTGQGPVPARILICGDFYNEHEERLRTPIAGPAGDMFTKLLHSAGILRSECFVTSLVHARPPRNDPSAWVNLSSGKPPPLSDGSSLHGRLVARSVREGFGQLLREIREVQPQLILTAGNLSLWALTEAIGALKWRGSQLYTQVEGIPSTKLIPLAPLYLLFSQEDARVMMRHDLGRAAAHLYPGPYRNRPQWSFRIRPSVTEAFDTLNRLLETVESKPTWVELDLETRAGHIACIGLSWSSTDALSIPLMCVESHTGYWAEEVEAILVHKLYKLLTHPNCWVRGQNLLYDCQYTYRHWHFIPNVKQDTMISHHTMFAGLPKALDFQSSLYCDYYRYWKESGKDSFAPFDERVF